MLRKMARLRRCIMVLSFGEYNSKKMYHCIFFLLFRLRSNLKNSCFEFHQGFRTPRNNKSTRPQAECFHLFLGVWNSSWTLALVFDILHEFTQGRLNLNNDWDIPFTSPYSISHERQGGEARAEDKCFLFSEISNGLVSCDSRSVDVFNQATKQPIGTTVDQWGNSFHQCFESKPINHEGGLLVPLRFFSSF